MRLILVALCLLVYSVTYVEADHECRCVTPQRMGYSTMTSSRRRRQATEREPIRIVPEFFEEDFNQLSPELDALFKSVINQSIEFLSSFLKVDRLTQNITLQRFCNTSEPLEFDSLNPFDHCTPDEPCQDTFCVLPEFRIPEKHLKACKTCDTFGSTNCSTDGEDGPGVADADFVIYVAARDFRCAGATLAFAAPCFLDKSTDRPIAGVVNLCPFLANETDIDNVVLTIVHELTHALVFNRLLFPFYRDENGNPRTPRNETTGLPSLGSSTIFIFQPSAETILQETVQREALHGVFPIDTVKVVTPAVLREARRHFDCPTLNGMELENLGPSSTAFTHWKKRMVANEAMTGVISTNGVFSRLTFALYEDSGWYDVDFSIASPLRFGLCLGCDFAENSCFSFGLEREPFCREQEFIPLRILGGRTRANSSCTFDHLAVATCNLVNFSDPSLSALNRSIPIEFQYFNDENLGGLEETMDFCPIQDAIPLAHCQRQRDLGGNVFMESVGPQSKCVQFEIQTDMEFNVTTVRPIFGGACYEVSCASEGSVTITVGENIVVCSSAGQKVLVPAGDFELVIICPAFEDICWENFTTCPSTTTPPLPTPSSPPPLPPSSGLSRDAAIAIGVVFGLLGVVIFVVALSVAVGVMCRRRGKKIYLSRKTQPDDVQGSYMLVGQGFLEKES